MMALLRLDSNRRRAFAAVVSSATLAVSLLLPAATAQAATDVTKEVGKGVTVSGMSVKHSDDGCLVTFTTVIMDAGYGSYQRITRDDCAGGTETGVYGSAVPTVFEVQGRLKSAHIVATIPLVDAATGVLTDQVFQLDSVWTATSKVVVEEKYMESSPVAGGHRAVRHFVVTRVEATAAGTVVLETGDITAYSQKTIGVCFDDILCLE